MFYYRDKSRTVHLASQALSVFWLPFATGYSQRDVPGPEFSSFTLHFDIPVTLQQFPNRHIKTYSITDEVGFFGLACHLHAWNRFLRIFASGYQSNEIPPHCSAVSILNVIWHLYFWRVQIFVPCQWKQGDCLYRGTHRTSTGRLSILDAYIQQVIADLPVEFQKLSSYPHPHTSHVFLLMHYCCNQKILQFPLGPHIHFIHSNLIY